MDDQTMEKHDTLDAWLDARPPAQRELFATLQDLIDNAAPDLHFGIKWGNPCWSDGSLALVFVHAKEDHLQLGFFGGSKLEDPAERLRGSAKFVRHIRVEAKVDVDDELSRMVVRALQAPPYRQKSSKHSK